MKARTRSIARGLQPLTRAARRVYRQPRLTLLGWHRIDDVGGGVSTRRCIFQAQLDVLAEWGAVVLPLTEAVRLMDAGRLPERAVCLSFDDGYASVIETAWPLLRERKLPATYFVVSDYLDGDRHFDWDPAGAADSRARLADRRAIADVRVDGLEIGSHTATHRWLPHLDDRELDDELRRSRSELEALLGDRIDTLAYPMGGWSPRVRDAAARAGYTLALTTDRGANSARRDRLALRRTLPPDTVEDLRLILDGAYDWLRPLDRWRVRNGPIW